MFINIFLLNLIYHGLIVFSHTVDGCEILRQLIGDKNHII